MDFDLSDEQQLLKDLISRWASDAYPSLGAVEASRKQDVGYSAARWAELADLGVLALPFAEQDGGIGGGPVETMLVMEQLGRSLAPEPFLASIVLGAGALRLAGTSAQKTKLLGPCIAGEARLAFAHEEVQARWEAFDITTCAETTDVGYRLTGEKHNVLFGEGVSTFIVSARTAGAQRETDGITLFAVPADAPTVTVDPHPTQDGGRAARVTFDGVNVSADAVIGRINHGLPIIESVLEHAIAAIAAEAVGAMEALHDQTIDYLKMRRQFGAHIGSFQSLQHKAADMLVALEQARSMAFYAAMMVEADDYQERRTALSAVKVQINRSARFVGQTAVQLHGGIGMTMEYLGAHHFRRLSVIELLFGDTAYHLDKVASEGGLVPAA